MFDLLGLANFAVFGLYKVEKELICGIVIGWWNYDVLCWVD